MALGSLYRKPFTCNVWQKIFTGKRDKFYRRAGYVNDPLPNIVHIAVWVPACIVWLYSASSSTVWWFSDHFFCLVCGPLEKKKKLAPTKISHYTVIQLLIIVTGFGKTLCMGFFQKIEFDAWLISSTIELTRVQFLGRSCAWLWRYSALFAIAPHPQ